MRQDCEASSLEEAKNSEQAQASAAARSRRSRLPSFTCPGCTRSLNAASFEDAPLSLEAEEQEVGEVQPPRKRQAAVREHSASAPAFTAAVAATWAAVEAQVAAVKAGSLASPAHGSFARPARSLVAVVAGDVVWFADASSDFGFSVLARPALVLAPLPAGRVLVRPFAFGHETLVQAAADPHILFLQPATRTLAASELLDAGGATVERLPPIGDRAAEAAARRLREEHSAARLSTGRPPAYVWDMLWDAAEMGVVDVKPWALTSAPPPPQPRPPPPPAIGAFVLLRPSKATRLDGLGGALSNKPLRILPQPVVQLVELHGSLATVRRFPRLCEVYPFVPSAGANLESTVFVTNILHEGVPLSDVLGPCTVLLAPTFRAPPPGSYGTTFVCHDAWTEGGLLPAEPHFIQPPPQPAVARAEVEPMTAFDPVAGCGALLLGLQDAGVVDKMYAADVCGEALQTLEANVKDCVTFHHDISLVLLACLLREGVERDSFIAAGDDVARARELLARGVLNALPLPGQVDIMPCGPPCQAFSGLNRFPDSANAQANKDVLPTTLSLIGHYRPARVLLEEVLEFFSAKGGLACRAALRELIAQRYQVKVGAVQAAYHSLGQSRVRLLLNAAQPGIALPGWPAMSTAADLPAPSIRRPDGTLFRAYGELSAPHPPVTVRDMLGDLPPQDNANALPAIYPATVEEGSAFSQRARGNGGETVVNAHVLLPMPANHLARARLIPPGGNGQTLLRLPEDDAGRVAFCLQFPGQPLVPVQCATSGNPGMARRLVWDSHSPVIMGFPQIFHQTGGALHADQDRIVTVRECARPQGFPDSFLFDFGDTRQKHKMIGNCVPVTLARAVGETLRESLLLGRH